VRGNPHTGVPGGWTVKILWVVNYQQAAWEARLPAETQAFVQAGRLNTRSPIYRFPGCETPLPVPAPAASCLCC